MPLSAKDAIKEFNVELLEELPLDIPIFFGKAKKANLFPLGTADEIEAKPTRARKVAYFLQHVVEPGAKEYLPKLLKVMKDSKPDNVVELAGKIEAAMKPATASTSSVPKGKELDSSDDTTASTSSMSKGKELDSSDDSNLVHIQEKFYS